MHNVSISQIFNLNGEPAELTPLDRGLAYGDGLFETICFINASPVSWDMHFTRLILGCKRLGITPLPDLQILLDCIKQTINKSDFTRYATVKIILTRGCGGSGYAIPKTQEPLIILSIRARQELDERLYVDGVRVKLCDLRLSRQPALAGLKHLNRLEQVLASQELKGTSYFEGLLLDDQDMLVEGIKTNVFYVKNTCLYTPSLDQCGVEGIMKKKVLEWCVEQKIKVHSGHFPFTDVTEASEMFLTNSLIGVVPVQCIDTFKDGQASPIFYKNHVLSARIAHTLNPQIDRTVF